MDMRIAVIPGDGIGKDVTAESVKVLTAVGERFGRRFDVERLPWGADHYLETERDAAAERLRLSCGNLTPCSLARWAIRACPTTATRATSCSARASNSTFTSTTGPVRLLDERLCPLKGRGPSDINFVVFRENTEGLYVGVGGRFKAGTEDEVAIQEELNTYKGVHRIVRHAFEFAKARGLAKVCMADKSNAMTDGHALWQRVFRELSAQYPDITATHYYIDALAMYMVLDPGQFQVIVTNNLFGDIITDLGATFQGGLGMAASGNLHPGKTSMFEPVHGSAPKFAGKNIANPIGAIASVALMLETCGLADEAAAIDAAILKAVRERQVTQDVGGTLGTREAGDFIAAAVRGP